MPVNLFAACRENDELIAKRVRVNHSVQQAIEAVFQTQEDLFRGGVTDEIEFDGSWKPDDTEVLVVDVPGDGQIFVDSIEANPVAIPDLDTANFDQENIRALFTGRVNGRDTTVLIQRFSPGQILSRRFSLLQDGNAFRRLDDQAFALDTSLTGIIEGGRMKFKSFHKMRAIVNLFDAYTAATDQEVQSFAAHDTFEVADPAAFLSAADQISRKLIHAINRSGTLNDFTVTQIETAATSVGLGINVNNGKIVMPAERAEIKKLLRFLDDGLYQAPLTQQRYITNSKRRA